MMVAVPESESRENGGVYSRRHQKRIKDGAGLVGNQPSLVMLKAIRHRPLRRRTYLYAFIVGSIGLPFCGWMAETWLAIGMQTGGGNTSLKPYERSDSEIQSRPLYEESVLNELVQERFPQCPSKGPQKSTSKMRSPLVRNIWLDRLPTNFQAENHPSSFSLVVCMLDQQVLDWLPDFVGRHGSHISTLSSIAKSNTFDQQAIMATAMSRSPQPARNPPIEWIVFPEATGCDHSYAYWINKAIASLLKDHVYVFLKNAPGGSPATSSRHRPLTDLVRLAQSDRRFACFHDWNPYHVTSVFANFTSKTTNPHTRASASMNEWLETMHIDLPRPITKVCYGGNFAVRGEQILNPRSPDSTGVYDRLLARLKQYPDEQIYAERSWAGLWAPPLHTGVATEMVKHATHLICHPPAILGALEFHPPEDIPFWKIVSVCWLLFAVCFALFVSLGRSVRLRR